LRSFSSPSLSGDADVRPHPPSCPRLPHQTCFISPHRCGVFFRAQHSTLLSLNPLWVLTPLTPPTSPEVSSPPNIYPHRILFMFIPVGVVSFPRKCLPSPLSRLHYSFHFLLGDMPFLSQVDFGDSPGQGFLFPRNSLSPIFKCCFILWFAFCVIHRHLPPSDLSCATNQASAIFSARSSKKTLPKSCHLTSSIIPH